MNKQKTVKKYLTNQGSRPNGQGTNHTNVKTETSSHSPAMTPSHHSTSLRDQYIRIEQQVRAKTPSRLIAVDKKSPYKPSDSSGRYQFFRNSEWVDRVKRGKYVESQFMSPSPNSTLRNQKQFKLQREKTLIQQLQEELTRSPHRESCSKWNSSVSVRDSEQLRQLEIKFVKLIDQNAKLKVENQQYFSRYKESVRYCVQMRKYFQQNSLGLKKSYKDAHEIKFDDQIVELQRGQEKCWQETIGKNKSLQQEVAACRKQSEEYRKINQFLKKQNSELLTELRQYRQDNASSFVLQKSSYPDTYQHKPPGNFSVQQLPEMIKNATREYEQRINNISLKLVAMESKCMNSQKIINRLMFERNLSITNAFKQSSQIQQNLRPVLGDNETPSEHLDLSQVQPSLEIVNEQTLQASKGEKSASSFRTQRKKVVMVDEQTITPIDWEINRKLIQEQLIGALKQKEACMQEMKKQIQRIREDNEQQLQANKLFEEQAEENRLLILALTKIRDQLANCNLQNFDIFIEDFESLLHEKWHAVTQLNKITNKQSNVGSKAWKLQKQLNQLRQKHRQLVAKYVRLQDYMIEKGVSQQSSFTAQKIIEQIYDSRVRLEQKESRERTCKYYSNMNCDLEEGKDAIKWNLYVKKTIEKTLSELSFLIG